MNSHTRVVLLLIFGAALVVPSPAAAHRLDEYLQATRIAVHVNRVHLEVDLTAGRDVAAKVLSLIDADGDGEVSAAEGAAYAHLVVASVILEVDNQVRPVTLVTSRFPSSAEMKAGVGVIRLEGSAKVPSATGRHRLFYQNTHQPTISVYVANALVPTSSRVAIFAQDRDTRQH